MNSDKLFKKNQRFFEKTYPGVALYVDQTHNPISKIIWDGDMPIDVDLGSGRFYKKPATEYVREQIDAYFDKPERVVLNQPEGVNLRSAYSVEMLQFMLNQVSLERKIELLGQSTENIGCLLIIGVGLGLHIEELIKRIKPRTAIIVEPISEFLYHSMHAIDWAKLDKWCKAHDINLLLTTKSAPEAIFGQINAGITENGRFRMDGSYIFTHYSTFVTNEVRNKVKEAAPYMLVIKGWFEDEVDMILNSSGNFIANEFRLIDGDPLPQRDEPAFIVASGPSLDQSIDVIKRWKDHAIIFSSGSSLQALLHHGIVPDYHVELENVPAVVDMLDHILELNKERFKDGRFKGIRLIASATVNPGVPPLFDETYLYIRDSVSSSLTFCGDYRPIYYAGPNVSNTSACLAAVIGFRNVYLFGCDCGSRSADVHHSKSTAYYTSKKFISGSIDPVKESSYKYPGNFGGMINTDILFNWNRDFLEAVIRLYSQRAFNCSDGVLIQGAAPTSPESVHFDGPAIDKKSTYETIRSGTRAFTAGEFLADHDLDAYVQQCDDFAAAMDKFIEKMKKTCKAPDKFYDALLTKTGEWKDIYAGPARVADGTVIGIPMVAMYFFNRIKESKDREDIFKGYLDRFGELMTAMGEKNRNLFDDVATRGREAKAKFTGMPVEPPKYSLKPPGKKKRKAVAKPTKKAKSVKTAKKGKSVRPATAAR